MFRFLKKRKKESLFSPVDGKIIPLEDVEDAVFSQKMMGDGFAVDPISGIFRSPCKGKITLLPETLHSFAITTECGAEVLVHIGLDTVSLGGEGFTSHTQIGDSVNVGDIIITFDMEQIRPKVRSMKSSIVITNSQDYRFKKICMNAQNGEPVITYIRK